VVFLGVIENYMLSKWYFRAKKNCCQIW